MNVKMSKRQSPAHEVTVSFLNYAQPSSLAILAVKKVTKNAVPKVITTLRVAHL